MLFYSVRAKKVFVPRVTRFLVCVSLFVFCLFFVCLFVFCLLLLRGGSFSGFNHSCSLLDRS